MSKPYLQKLTKTKATKLNPSYRSSYNSLPSDIMTFNKPQQVRGLPHIA